MAVDSTAVKRQTAECAVKRADVISEQCTKILPKTPKNTGYVHDDEHPGSFVCTSVTGTGPYEPRLKRDYSDIIQI